jgi:hypothetical protein
MTLAIAMPFLKRVHWGQWACVSWWKFIKEKKGSQLNKNPNLMDMESFQEDGWQERVCILPTMHKRGVLFERLQYQHAGLAPEETP